MPTPISRHEVQRLMQEEMAQLVEVLPSQEYEGEHIAGAISIPLKRLNGETTSHLDKSIPVVVYWHDAAWDISPRAAWRLETLGFTKVYDYEAGKADWFAAGLPREGRLSNVSRAGDVARSDDITCQLTERLGNVTRKVRESGGELCIVTTEGGVVLGRIRGNALDGDSDALVEDVMEPGPTTVRTNETLEPLVERMRSRNVDNILVTTSDGRLVGTLYRTDAESRIAQETDQLDAEEESCICNE